MLYKTPHEREGRSLGEGVPVAIFQHYVIKNEGTTKKSTSKITIFFCDHRKFKSKEMIKNNFIRIKGEKYELKDALAPVHG